MARQLPKASDLVVKSLREHIISQRLPAGEQLPSESELMEEHQVGRVSVREALRLLERDGLIEVRRGTKGGIFVRHPEIRRVSEVITMLFGINNTTLREFVEFRQIVEPKAARLAARNLSDSDRFEIEKVINQTSDLEHVPDLHMIIAEATGNGVLSVALNSLHLPFGEHFRPERISNEQLHETAAAHKKIARFVIDGNEDGAEETMNVHLAAYRQYLEDEALLDASIIPDRAISR